MTLEELRSLAPERRLIVDARGPLMFQTGHIPGAVSIARKNLPQDMSRSKPLLEASRNKEIVVYCSDEACEDAPNVARELLRVGLSHVSVFFGGWREWQQNGLTEEKGPPG